MKKYLPSFGDRPSEIGVVVKCNSSLCLSFLGEEGDTAYLRPEEQVQGYPETTLARAASYLSLRYLRHGQWFSCITLRCAPLTSDHYLPPYLGHESDLDDIADRYVS